jgi:hypothetical protein
MRLVSTGLLLLSGTVAFVAARSFRTPRATAEPVVDPASLSELQTTAALARDKRPFSNLLVQLNLRVTRAAVAARDACVAEGSPAVREVAIGLTAQSRGTQLDLSNLVVRQRGGSPLPSRWVACMQAHLNREAGQASEPAPSGPAPRYPAFSGNHHLIFSMSTGDSCQ